MRFSQLTRPARVYVIGTYLLALGLLLAVAPHDAARAEALGAGTLAVWTSFVPLLVLATLAHSFPVHTPNRQSYYVSLPFFTAAILLLHPAQLAVVLVVPNLVEWRFRHRSWIAQLFNVAVYLIGGLAARAVFHAAWRGPFSVAAVGDGHAVVAAALAILMFLMLNRALVSGAIALANRMPPFGMAELESLAGEAILLGMGAPLAALAAVAPWALVPAAAPLFLVHRAFEMPHMRAQRRHDELTGLYTQPYLEEAASRELNRARRFDRSLSLLWLGVPGFESTSTDHGRQAGDLILRRVAALLRHATREYDVAARVGESTFALLLPECDRARATAIARRLQTALADEPIEIPSRLEPLPIRLAIGVVAAPANTSTEALFGAAQQSLARAEVTFDGIVVVDAVGRLVEPSPAASETPPRAAEPAVEPAVIPELPAPLATPAGGMPRSIVLQVGVFLLAASIAVPLLPSLASLDALTTLCMVGFVVLAELLGIELFGRGSAYSISTVPIIAAGLLLGPASVVVVAPVGMLVRAVHLRTRWHKLVFNVSTQVIAAVAATLLFQALTPDLSLDHLAWMIVAAALAGGAFYLHTLLVALAMAFELRVSPLRIWAEHFRWLWIQYLVLGALGLLLALAYHLFGLLGALIFVVPAVTMRYVAKQYLDRTMDHVRQLRALNEHLASEVTQRRQSQVTLEHQALHDVLTDLPNRVLLQDRAQQSLLAAQRDGHSMALLLLDLDRFKEVNDTLGHHAGDELLKQTAARLQRALRKSDTIARLGGDEFAALLPTADATGAVDTAQRLADALASSFDLDGRAAEVHASIGIALAEPGDTPHALLRRADVAMYAAKRSGGGYRLYAAEQDQNSPERLARIAELRIAAANRELELHYQPKLDLRTGKVNSVEALIRWRHPRLGLLPPSDFIPLAEATGLIEHVSQWALDTAMKQCHRWRDAGLPLDVAVNLSMRDLHNPDLPDTIAQLLGAHGLVPESLIVEITESTIMADPQHALGVAGALSRMGVRLAIDDFGSGYSSVAYLRQLAVDELKIDQTFVRQLAASADDATIVRSTISLGHDLGLTLVAEGVEDQRAVELLTAYGCDAAQGFFIGRPMPPGEIADFVRGRARDARDLPLAA